MAAFIFGVICLVILAGLGASIKETLKNSPKLKTISEIIQIRFLLVFVSLLWTAGSAQALECYEHIGKTVKPTSFDAALAMFKKSKPKGEFETTEDFEARSAALWDSANVMIVERMPHQAKESVIYDADVQMLMIYESAFTGERTLFTSLDDEQRSGGKIGSVEIVLSSSDKKTGSYVGTNSYGAKGTIHKISTAVRGLVDSSIGGGYSFFDGYKYISLMMEPADAKATKPGIKLGVMGVPKPPFVVRGRWPGESPTLSSPYDTTFNGTYLVLDFQCALVMDAKNAVLGAAATH